MRIINRQNGETIIEVLLSVAVLGLVLAASYTLANKSTQANRRSQERTEALNQTSARIEQFKTYLENGGNIPSGTFCVYENNSGQLRTAIFSSSVPPNAQNDTLSVYPARCKSGTDNRYNTSIHKTSGTYVITTRWFRAAGGGVDEMALAYRIYNEDDIGPGGIIPDPAPEPGPSPPAPAPEPEPGPTPGPCYKGCGEISD